MRQVNTQADSIRCNVEILRFISWSKASRGYAPTLREIGAQLGWTSSSTVQYHLVALREAGLIVWQPALPRTIMTTDKATEYVKNYGGSDEHEEVKSGR